MRPFGGLDLIQYRCIFDVSCTCTVPFERYLPSGNHGRRSAASPNADVVFLNPIVCFPIREGTQKRQRMASAGMGWDFSSETPTFSLPLLEPNWFGGVLGWKTTCGKSNLGCGAGTPGFIPSPRTRMFILYSPLSAPQQRNSTGSLFQTVVIQKGHQTTFADGMHFQ